MEISKNTQRKPDKTGKKGIRSEKEQNELVDLGSGLGFIVSILK